MFKKFTCMALTFFMLLTMLPAVYADDATPPEGETNITFTDVDMQSNMGKAIQKLVEKNIINGYEDNTFKPEQTITRAEFTAIIARWKNVDDQVEENPVTGFPDVDNQEVYWAKKYIRAIKDLNIINGFEDGTFRPNEPVTYEQAIKMVVASLGYKDLAWPQGWIDMANQKALLTDVSHQGQQADPVNRGNVAVLVFNALEVPPAAEQTAPPTQSAAPTQTKKPSNSGSGNGGGIAVKPKETPKIDYGTVTGVVDATWYTGLSYGDNKLDKTQVSIDGVVYDTEGVSESSIVNKIGYRVTLKVKREKNGPWIGYALSEDSANSTVSVQNDFIESFAFDEESGYYLLDYYRKDGGPMLTAKIQQNVKIIYNERAVEPSEINEAYIKNMLDKLIANEGSVELVNNDTKSANFEVLRVSLFETFVAKSTNKSTRTLNFFYGAGPITVPEEDTFSNVIRFTGSIKEFNEIQKYNVLRIQRSLDDFYMVVDGSSAKRSGTLTSVSSSGKIGLDNGTASIGLSKLYENTTHADKVALERGREYDLYLDRNGDVAFVVDKTATLPSTFAYITWAQVERDDASGDDVAYVQMYKIGSTSSAVPIQINKNVVIDGVTYKEDPQGVLERLKKTAKLINDVKNPDKNSNTDFAQLVRYTLTNGKITMIDTVANQSGELDASDKETETNKLKLMPNFICDDKEGDGRLTYMSSGGSTYFYKEGSSEKFYVNSSSTKKVFVPSNRRDFASVAATNFNASDFISGYKYYVEAYGVIGNSSQKFLIQYYDKYMQEFNAYTPMGVITGCEEITSGTNEGNYRLKVRDFTYKSTSMGSVKTLTLDDNWSNFVEDFLYADKTAYMEGSVIRYTLNNAGEVNNIQFVMDINNLPNKVVNNLDDAKAQRLKEVDTYDEVGSSSGMRAKFRTSYGVIDTYDDTSRTLISSLKVPTDNQAFDEGELVTYESINDAKVMIYDESETKIENRMSYYAKLEDNSDGYSLFGDLSTVQNQSSDTVDQVFVYSCEGSVKLIYIIRRPSLQESPADYAGAGSVSEASLENVLPDESAEGAESAEGVLQAVGEPASATDENLASDENVVVTVPQEESATQGATAENTPASEPEITETAALKNSEPEEAA